MANGKGRRPEAFCKCNEKHTAYSIVSIMVRTPVDLRDQITPLWRTRDKAGVAKT